MPYEEDKIIKEEPFDYEFYQNLVYDFSYLDDCIKKYALKITKTSNKRKL